MTSKARDNATVAGIGVAACAACCAGPILGVFAALGLGAVAGTLLFGMVGLIIAGAISAVVVRQRRRRPKPCVTPSEPTATAVTMSATRPG
jgi:hypothetical protein